MALVDMKCCDCAAVIGSVDLNEGESATNFGRCETCAAALPPVEPVQIPAPPEE